MSEKEIENSCLELVKLGLLKIVKVDKETGEIFYSLTEYGEEEAEYLLATNSKIQEIWDILLEK